jgi:hypothetical protein
MNCNLSKNPLEDAIITYIETKGDVRTNLNVKIIKLNNLGIMDSVPDNMKPIVEFLFIYKDTITLKIEEYKVDELKNVNYDRMKYIDKREVIVKEGITDNAMLKKWECIYEINNPALNNVKQTITKTFIIADNNKILGVLDDK